MLTLAQARTINLCAGPGGWEAAAHILGGQQLLDRLAILGIEIDPDASATGRAAGYHRLTRDIRLIAPETLSSATGLIASTPCPTFSTGGRGAGLKDEQFQMALDAITGIAEGCTLNYDYFKTHATDPRSTLVVEVARYMWGMPELEWVICEQVPGTEELWVDLSAEVFAANWDSANVAILDATDFGTTARRTRAYFIASRDPSGGWLPPRGHRLAEPISLAAALHRPDGEQVRTRNDRKATGGNLFSADGLSWCLTGSSRSWTWESDGSFISPAEGGFLNGFPATHPWQGTRSSQWQQVADVVCPPVGAAILGAVLAIDCRPALRAWALDRTGGFPTGANQSNDLAGALFAHALQVPPPPSVPTTHRRPPPPKPPPPAGLRR